jgi:hypothetical protein
LEKRKEFNLPKYILFLDYEKAYNKTNRKLLWTILREASVPVNLIKAIRNVYSNTYISIQEQGKGQQRSENIKTNKGVRQGCGLSPILFNFYINTLVKVWKAKTKSGIQVTKNNKRSTILYADDRGRSKQRWNDQTHLEC